MLGMARLAAPLFLRSSRGRVTRRLGMRVLPGGRQRRIEGCVLGSRQLGFQGSDPSILLGDTNQQRPDNSLGLWWLPSEHIFRDERCLGHATYVADFVFGAKANLMPQLHRRVNGYWLHLRGTVPARCSPRICQALPGRRTRGNSLASGDTLNAQGWGGLSSFASTVEQPGDLNVNLGRRPYAPLLSSREFRRPTPYRGHL